MSMRETFISTFSPHDFLSACAAVYPGDGGEVESFPKQYICSAIAKTKPPLRTRPDTNFKLQIKKDHRLRTRQFFFRKTKRVLLIKYL